MILRFLRFLFERDDRSPYLRGLEYAQEQLLIYGMEKIPELKAQSLGSFNTTEREDEFDSGIREAVYQYERERFL